LENCIKNWFEDKFVPSNLVAQICWNIWLKRNKAIFEGSTPTVQEVYYRTLTQPGGIGAKKKDKLPKSMFVHIQNNTTIVYFDGVEQQHGSYCGVGGVLKMPNYSSINSGQGTNTKAELLGAWAVIRLELHLSINRI